MSLLAIIIVREGAVPAGGEEALAEANGVAIVVGSGATEAAATLVSARSVFVLDLPHVAIGSIARALRYLRPVLDAKGIILPASPDGRDLAPLLAHHLQRPLFAAATQVGETHVTCVRTAGRVGRYHHMAEPFVATLVPGVRGTTRYDPCHEPPTITSGEASFAREQTRASSVMSIDVQPPDPSTMDLTEARCIVGGGLGLSGKDRFDQLGRIGALIGASLGGTRVASDAGWIPFERQIGTTGVAVRPSIYLAFGISGATQHTSGLGDPDHVVSVNTDPSCPMMTMADIAIVSDAAAVLDALEHRLSALTSS